MVRGLFTAYTGMTNEQKRLDVISNNLANAATVGYKESDISSKAFDDVLTLKIKDASEPTNSRKIGTMSLGVMPGEQYTNYEQGSLKQTTGTYDLALEGDGFFNLSVTDKAGNVSTQYTRNGSFTMAKDGHIVDESGNYLMGESGAIIVPTNAREIKIDKTGGIYADDEYIDTVKVSDFEDYNYMIKAGDSMYQALDGAVEKESSASIQQGYLEQSNVNVVSEMVNLITTTRSYEANQKMIKTVDQTLDLAVNSVGKV